MNRMPTLRILAPALLGTVLALGAALPASAARQDRDNNDQRADRKQRPAQREQPRAEASRRPVQAERSRSSDDQRRENWGELARQAQQRQRAESPRPAFEAQRAARVADALEAEVAAGGFATHDAGFLALVSVLGYCERRHLAFPWRQGRPGLAALFDRVQALACVSRTVPPAGMGSAASLPS